MKKLLSIIILCLGCFGFLEAQDNTWKLINCETPFLGAASNGDLFATDEYGCLLRSQDEGETWTQVNNNSMYQCIAFSPEGRIFVFPTSNMCLQFSDDRGDTWQATTTMASCAMYDVGGLCAPSNDIVVVWATNGETYWTIDGGETWDFASLELDEDSQVSDMIVNAEGDVYVSVWSYSDGDTGIFHSTLSDIENWEIVAGEELNIRDMALDPEGNVVACGYHIDGSSIGFQHTPGFYLFDGTTLAISDGGIVYRPHFVGNQAVLSYSTDHGEHFTDIGEHLPLVDIAPGGDAYFLIKGHDNHLYFDGGGEYWKCIRDADHIRESFPLENTAWVQFYRSLYEDSTYYQLGIKGDTVVNEMAYKKVINCAHLGYPIEGECFGGIREDGDGKCYFMSFVPSIAAPWPLHYDCEVNTEYPLYDFSLSVCDVFQTIGLTPHVVFDTAEMELNGSTRKVLWFDTNCDNGNLYYYQWIEGIGSTHSLLYPIQDEPDNGPEYRLVEVWQDEQLLYRNPHFDDYVPLVHEGNDRQKWNVVYIGSMNYPNDYHTEIQSIRDNINLDGVDYKLVWTESVYQSKRIAGAVREEDKRVYFRRYWGQSYEDEVLLYDFNLTVGDTVAVGWSDYQLIVLEESQVEVNGAMRRQLGLAEYAIGPYPPSEVDEYWIEGVGSTYGFLNSGYEGWVGAFVHLLCYHENGDLVWDNEAFDDCVMNSEGTPASFAPQEAEWYFDVFDPWGTHPEYERFYVDGDTIIQGHLCSIISQHFVDTGHDGEEYVYEEDNKVYWFNPTTNAFSTLYDFDAEAGESWYYEVGECSHLAIVDSVGSVTWNGHTYRTQWVTFNDDFPVYYIYHRGRIIEGIGYERGLFPNYYICNGLEVYDYSEIEYLRCYVDDGEMLYHEGGYDCDYTNITPPSYPEWYYEIQNENGTITYQYLYQAGDTIIQDEPTHILVRINTLYDKGLRDEVTHEYVFELNGKVYWWNSTLGVFTVLYDYEAEVGDSWNIFVGTEILTMHVDAVEEIEYEGRVWRMLCVSDPENLFSGNIVCGIGHLTSFFPERLMNNGDGVRVEGMRCYWVDDELVFKYGDEDCDAIISDLHGVEENGPSTGSGALTVYPNPTNGVLFVRTHVVRPYEEYRITNIVGQTLLQGRITDETQQIDVSGLAEGMYFINIGGMTVKFIKQ